MTLIMHTYSLLFTTFTPPSPPHNKKHPSKRDGKGKKRGGYHTTEGAEGKKVGKSVVERCISTPIPNYLSTHLSLPLNHKSAQNSVGKVAMWSR